MSEVRILQGDCRDVLKTLPDESVHMCCTSPPYFGLRSYGIGTENGEIGLEKTPDAYVAELVAVFREVRRVLCGDGVLFVNLGDSYARSGKARGGGGNGPSSAKQVTNAGAYFETDHPINYPGIKPKDLIGIPWMVAFALQADGWYLRSDIIWHKPNPMPEAVTDRPTKSHEYLFLLSKSAKYHYDADAIAEPASDALYQQVEQGYEGNGLKDYAANGIQNPSDVKSRIIANARKRADRYTGKLTRNKRTVWTVPTGSFNGAHFACFPPDLIKPCILAGCPVGGTVLDCFGGSGTSGMVARELGRNAILIELNPDYLPLIEARINVTPGLPL